MSSTISPVQSGSGSGVVFSDVAGSLDQRMISKLGQLSESASQKQQSLIEAIGEGSTDPTRLLSAQADLAKFQIAMSLHSTLARKAVAVVETLVKS